VKQQITQFDIEVRDVECNDVVLTVNNKQYEVYPHDRNDLSNISWFVKEVLENRPIDISDDQIDNKVLAINDLLRSLKVEDVDDIRYVLNSADSHTNQRQISSLYVYKVEKLRCNINYTGHLYRLIEWFRCIK